MPAPMVPFFMHAPFSGRILCLGARVSSGALLAECSRRVRAKATSAGGAAQSWRQGSMAGQNFYRVATMLI